MRVSLLGLRMQVDTPFSPTAVNTNVVISPRQLCPCKSTWCLQAPSRYQVAICISQPDLASQPIPNVTTASLAQASSQASSFHAANLLTLSLTHVHLPQAARTEVSDTTRSPDFANRVFVLQLQSWRQSNRPAMLTCEVYAVPSKGTHTWKVAMLSDRLALMAGTASWPGMHGLSCMEP